MRKQLLEEFFGILMKIKAVNDDNIQNKNKIEIEEKRCKYIRETVDEFTEKNI